MAAITKGIERVSQRAQVNVVRAVQRFQQASPVQKTDMLVNGHVALTKGCTFLAGVATIPWATMKVVYADDEHGLYMQVATVALKTVANSATTAAMVGTWPLWVPGAAVGYALRYI